MVQHLRLHLPMQGTRVQSLVQEDVTGRGTTEPVTTAAEPVNSRAGEHRERNSGATAGGSSHLPQLEKVQEQLQRPGTAGSR